MNTVRLARIAAALFLLAGVYAGPGAALAQDIQFTAVLKAQRYEQASASLVMLVDDDDDAAIAFETVVFGSAADSLVSGSVQVPSGGPSLPLVTDGPGQWGVDQGWESLVTLNTARPDGTYTVSLVTKNDGSKSVTATLTGEVYPPIPKVTNFTALQSINSSTATPVEWNSMGGTSTDFVLCSVRDDETNATAFESPGPGQPGALNGLSTSVVIPAGLLEAGRIYAMELMFVKVVDSKEPPAAYCTVFAGYSRTSQLEIATTAPAGQSLHADLDETIPANYGWNIAGNSLVSFRFTRPMSPSHQSINWSGTGLVPANFSYEWRDGNRILLCRYSSNLPANTDINWSLDLTGFRDANDVPLTGTRSGSFHTSPDPPEASSDATNCFLIKAKGYLQTGTSPVASGMWGCDAEVAMSAYNRVKEPLILNIAANSTTSRLWPDEWDADFYAEATYADQAHLDLYFPNGDFSFSLPTVADGNKTVTLSLGTTDDYPAPPTVSNLAALQAIDPTTATQISWTAPADWNPEPTADSTFIEVEIENEQGNEVLWFSPGERPTNDNGCVIPAGSLFPGRTYRVWLTFVKVKDIDQTYGWCATGFQTITEFSIKTTGTPAMPDVAIGRNNNGTFLNLTAAEPYRNYVMEISRDLVRWLPQQSIWMGQTDSTNQWYDNDAQYLPKRFYRLRDMTAAEMEDGWINPNVDIQGVVYADGSHTTTVAGAIVGTTLDDQTVTTDPAGGFFLETATNFNNDPAGQSYSVKITVSGQTKTYGPFTGAHPRNQYYEWATGGYGVTGP
jgi:hypothetical protein